MRKINYSIRLARVFGMFSIVFCHIFSLIGISAVSQILNVGIFIFLFISGYLYSEKTIERGKRWMIERWKKLYIPILFWIMFVSAFMFFSYKVYPSILEIIVFSFNLQGIPWLLCFLPKVGTLSVALTGLSHLWFVTIIFFCYIFLIIVQKYKIKEKVFLLSKKEKCLLFVLLLFAMVLLACLKINTVYFMCFFLGYFCDEESLNVSKVGLGKLLLTMVFAISIRIVGKIIFDGTVLYDICIVGISHTIIAMCIVCFIFFVVNEYSLIASFAKGKLIETLDNYSYYVYITHYFFLNKSFGRLFDNSIIQFVAFFFATIIFSVLLKKVTEATIRLINSKTSKNMSTIV